MTPSLQIIQGDALAVLKTLPGDSVHCVVTSPPFYGLRDYSVPGQIGLEPTLDEFLNRLVAVFDEARRVLHPSGVCFLDMGDSYAGSGKARGGGGMGPSSAKQITNPGAYFEGVNGDCGLAGKQRCLIPFRLALALQANGWWVRDVIAWTKPAPMPESVTDRCTQSWEPILMLTKSARYFWDAEAVREPLSDATSQRDKSPRGRSQNGGGSMESMSGYDYSRDGLGDMQSNPAGRNLRNVWSIGPEPFTDTVLDANGKPTSHYAAFPSDLPRRCILAGTSARGVCPKCGEPWTREVEKTMPPLRLVNGKGPHGEHGLLGGARFDDPIQTRTIGWQPGCHCAKLSAVAASPSLFDPVPATVLDIFLGTGTTAAVALELGRNAIGIELSPWYIRLAERRCNAVTPGLALA